LYKGFRSRLPVAARRFLGSGGSRCRLPRGGGAWGGRRLQSPSAPTFAGLGGLGGTPLGLGSEHLEGGLAIEGCVVASFEGRALQNCTALCRVERADTRGRRRDQYLLHRRRAATGIKH